MDYPEAFIITEQKQSSQQDTSFTVNAQRMINGMDKSELRNLL